MRYHCDIAEREKDKSVTTTPASETGLIFPGIEGIQSKQVKETLFLHLEFKHNKLLFRN